MIIDYSRGVESFYLKEHDRYRNPHEYRVQKVLGLLLDKLQFLKMDATVLDFACGSGEAALYLQLLYPSIKISYSDPYTKESLLKRISNAPFYEYTFKDVVNGALREKYTLILISYAFHLVPDDMKVAFLVELSINTEYLLLIHPHKKEKDCFGFSLIATTKYDQTVAYLYKSDYFIPSNLQPSSDGLL